MALNNLKKLTPRTIRTLGEANYTPLQISQMSSNEVIDAYLTYTGIIGFTPEIVDLILTTKRAFGEIRLTDKETHHG